MTLFVEADDIGKLPQGVIRHNLTFGDAGQRSDYEALTRGACGTPTALAAFLGLVKQRSGW